MKIAISNIAWDQAEDTQVAEMLLDLGVSGIEVAPSKIWPKPLNATKEEILAYRNWWNEKGISIVAMQALLFNQPDLTIFENSDARRKTLEYLSQLIGLAEQLGVKAMVFGSPKNRVVNGLDRMEANKIAKEFFGALGSTAESHGVKFCLEPNPSVYGCDYMTNGEDAQLLVKEVNHPGFRLHLDTGGMILNGEGLKQDSFDFVNDVAHFHISEPYLEVPNQIRDVHSQYAAVLKNSGYDGWVSIEMKPPEEEGRVNKIKSILEQVIAVYT